MGGNTDFYYTVTLGGNAVLSSVLWTGMCRLMVILLTYSSTTGRRQYVTERTLPANGTTQVEESFAAVSAYTGIGANLGQVRFRSFHLNNQYCHQPSDF